MPPLVCKVPYMNSTKLTAEQVAQIVAKVEAERMKAGK